ncbi:MAG: GDP-mannose 4,6-dehydratase [Gemmataceae bacterium]
MEATSPFWQDRRVFVTGVTGLVGAWTVKSLLDRGAHVVGLVRDHVAGAEIRRAGLLQQIDLVHGSVEDCPVLERALAEYEIQTVVHLAAQTIVGIARRSPLSTFESNIKGTWSVLEAARRCGSEPQVIIASSDKAYGEQTNLPYLETAPLRAHHPYDVSKACADMLGLTYYQTYGLPVCVTRCGNFFGGGDLNWNRLIPGTIRSILRGQRPVIRSDGSYVRDYFYVKDGAEAYMQLAECMAGRPDVVGQAFNFSNEVQVTAEEMVCLITRHMQSDLEPDIRGEATHEIKHQYLSAAKAHQMLDWQPRYSLVGALAETIAWYRAYFKLDERPAKTQKESRNQRVSKFDQSFHQN